MLTRSFLCTFVPSLSPVSPSNELLVYGNDPHLSLMYSALMLAILKTRYEISSLKDGRKNLKIGNLDVMDIILIILISITVCQVSHHRSLIGSRLFSNVR
ncbi:hypothetical protein BDR04DRAFT_1090136 [Suillus decipiens]|nr:hypothetical protein BDR04DRAFT_1090136 [Suillus decipiens]